MKSTIAPHETSVKCLRIVCKNGLTVRLTRYPVDLKMSNGEIYKTDSGYDFTGYTASASMAPSAIDLEGFAGVAGITRDAIQSGVFDGARCYLFATSFKTPMEDHEPIVASLMGKTTIEDARYKVEEMALIDALNQSVGKSYTAPCQKLFGGQEFAGCKINLAVITVTGILTSVSSSTTISDSTRGESNDYFAGGTIGFTSGQNTGLKPLEIKSYSGGVIVTHEPFYYTPAVGDYYTMTPGCRKRLEDCRDKWNNVINFGGFSFIPTSSQYTQFGGNQ